MTDVASFPSPEEVERIIQRERDPVVRNLQITQGYHDLSMALYKRTGEGWINWCSLGCWASKTAGNFIRGEEIPKVFRASLMDDGPFAEVSAHEKGELSLMDIAEGIVGDISAYIMEGNRVVFQELAGTISKLLTDLGDDTSFDGARLKALQETFKPGMPEPDFAEIKADGTIDPQTRGGQQLLAEMVGAYYQAMFETDSNKRAELMLLGNALGGLHEQTRLQTYIKRSLEAPITDLLRTHAREQAREIASGDELNALEGWIDSKLPTVGRFASKLWEEFGTVAMMTLTLPDGVLHLSEPIKHAEGYPLIPAELEQIQNPDLAKTLEKYRALNVKVVENPLERLGDRVKSLFGVERDKSSGALDVGALDWTQLDQRMTFILSLFRSRADDDALVRQPFNRTQRRVIAKDRKPAGRL